MTNSNYLKPELNTPYTVALKYPTPIRVKGFDGWQLRYILLDGRALYLPEDFKPKMEALRLKPGQRFTVEKRSVGRKVEWSVRLSDKQPAAAILDAQESLDSPLDEIPRSPLDDALKLAVTAAASAEKHAAAIGYSIRFRPEDVRAMAISVLISNDRRAA